MSPILPLFAQAAPAAGGSPWPQLILQFALIGLIFYFLMIRPQQKQRKEQENALMATCGKATRSSPSAGSSARSSRSRSR